MGVLVESLLPNVQVVRFVDGGQNGRQGGLAFTQLYVWSV